MPTVTFENGQSVDFDKMPSPQDIDEVALKLGVKKSAPLTPKPFGAEPSFKASMGGASSIIPNTFKTFGNIPSDIANITDTALQSTAGNIGRSLGIATDIYKDRGFVQGSKDIASGWADTTKKIADFPAKVGTYLGETNTKLDLQNKLSPIQEQTLKQQDDIFKKLAAARAQGKDTSHLILALKYNQDTLDSLNTQIGTQDSRQQGAQQLSDIIKYPIEHPAQVAIAAEGMQPETQANISSKIKPITSSVENVIPKTRQAISESLTARQPQAINELEQTYNDLMSSTTPGKKKIAKIETKTQTMNRAGTEGKTPMRTLAEEGVIPNQTGTKLDTYEQAQGYKQKISPLRDANKQALTEAGLSTAPVRLDDLETKAIEYARTPDNINAGRFDKMEREIRTEFNLLRKNYPTGEVPLNIVDDIKSARWDNVFKNKSLIEADMLKKDSEYAIAKSLQKSIEEIAARAGNPEVAQLNRAIGDKLEAAKFLEELNGKTVKGGRLLKYVTTGIGSSFGHTIPGKIIGAIGGNMVGDLIISNTVASPLKRLILRGLEVKDPEAYIKTIQWLEKQNLDRETRLLLSAPKNEGIPSVLTPPAPTTFETPSKIINREKSPAQLQLPAGTSKSQGTPIYLPSKVRETNLGIDEVKNAKINYEKSPASQQTIPAIKSESKNPISSTIPKSTSKSNIPEGLQPLAKEARKYKSAEEFQNGLVKNIEKRFRSSDLEASSLDINMLRRGERSADISKEAVAQAKESILKGNSSPIVIDKNNQILDGHHRFEAYKELGHKRIPILRVEGENKFGEPRITNLTDFYNKAVGKKSVPFIPKSKSK